jgi:peptidoglycan-associated lipoprotein
MGSLAGDGPVGWRRRRRSLARRRRVRVHRSSWRTVRHGGRRVHPACLETDPGRATGSGSRLEFGVAFCDMPHRATVNLAIPYLALGIDWRCVGLPLAHRLVKHSREVVTMKSMSLAPRSSTLVLSLAPLLLVSACAAAKSPVASVVPTPTMATATPPAANRQATEPTRGTIAISEEIRTACGIPEEDAFFAFDSATVESIDIKRLDAVARCFTTGPLTGRRMRLVGHADPRGPSEYNMTLGQRRADSVEGYIGRRGVQLSRVTTTSRGAMDATGQDEAGWEHDRRVDVQLGG